MDGNRRMNMKKLLSLGVAMALACAYALAQNNEAPKVSVNLPKTAKAGKAVEATIVLTFAEGLHGYQNPPSDPTLIPVEVSVDTKGIKVKSIKYPAGKDEKVTGEDKPVRVYEGTIKIPVTFIAPKKGKTQVTFKVH